jgi:hypothetical protein
LQFLVLHFLIKPGDIPYIFSKTFGGKVSKQPTYYIFQRVGGNAVKVLEILLPYLILKKDRAELVIEYDQYVGYRSIDAQEIRAGIMETFNLLKEV